MNGLKLLRRQQQTNGIKGAYVFINERGQSFGRAACAAGNFEGADASSGADASTPDSANNAVARTVLF
jgi:hypothetical protein